VKKIVYISALLLGLVFVSCQKEEVVPRSQDMTVPVWQGENARGGSNDSGGAGTDISDEDGKGTLKGDGEITDPNLDPDAD
jgi:hypothetical protein